MEDSLLNFHCLLLNLRHNSTLKILWAIRMEVPKCIGARASMSKLLILTSSKSSCTPLTSACGREVNPRDRKKAFASCIDHRECRGRTSKRGRKEAVHELGEQHGGQTLLLAGHSIPLRSTGTLLSETLQHPPLSGSNPTA